MKAMLNRLVVISCLTLASMAASAEHITLTEGNIVPVYGAILPGMGEVLANYVSSLRQVSSQKIYFLINSQGGSVAEADKLVDLINSTDNCEVVSVYSASAAAGILQLVSKKVHMIKKSSIMFHNVSDFVRQKSLTFHQYMEAARDLRVYERKYFSRVSKRSKIPTTAFMKKLDNTEWRINSKQAKSLNMIDEESTAICNNKSKNMKILLARPAKAVSLCYLKPVNQ